MKPESAPRILHDLKALGELPPELAARVEGTPPDAMTDAEVFDDDPPAAFVGAVKRKLAAERRPRAASYILPILALATALFVVGRPLLHGPGPDVVLKGTAPAPHLEVWRQKAEGVEALADGAEARAGDRLQLAYASGGHGFGVIYSLDAQGVVTEHHRFGGEAEPGRVKVDASFTLDDAPGFEAFYLVTSDRAFDIGFVLELARESAAEGTFVDLPDGLDMTTLVVRKAP
jgi:hypothetical protein